MLLGTLGASLLRNTLAGKGTVRAGYGNKRQEKVRSGYDSKNFQSCLILLLTLKYKGIIRLNPNLMVLFT